MVYSYWGMWVVFGGIFLLLVISFSVLGWLHKSNSTLAIRWREMDENTPVAHFHEHQGMAFLHEHPKGNKTHTHTHIGVPIDDYVKYLEYKRDPYRQ